MIRPLARRDFCPTAIDSIETIGCAAVAASPYFRPLQTRTNPAYSTFMCRYDVRVTVDPLPVVPPVFSPMEGAVVDFFGVVRETENHAKISGLAYEAFVEMAEAELHRISEIVAAKYDLGSVTIHHRIGFVPAGEPSLFARVTAAHRGEAFAGSQHLIELLKDRVPIWKHPSYLQARSA